MVNYRKRERMLEQQSEIQEIFIKENSKYVDKTKQTLAVKKNIICMLKKTRQN